MNFRSPLLSILVFVLGFSAASALAQTNDQAARIDASFVLALGRLPSPAEKTTWEKVGTLSFAELIARHRAQLTSDAALRRECAGRAWGDAFGRAAPENEIAATSREAKTYTELLQQHLRSFADHPADYEAVQQRAYQLVIHRDPYREEIDYWKKLNPLPFALLVGGIEDWARRNQPGLMVTSGTATVTVNSEFLTTVRLSPTAAKEARAAAGISGEGRLIAAGADQLGTGGGIYFTAAGKSETQKAR